MLKASLSPNPFPNSVPLQGATFPTGAKLYIWFDVPTLGAKVPFTFLPSGQKENTSPYEYKGGTAVTFPDGTQTVTVTDNTGATVGTATFTVGSTTPPPTGKTTVKLTANLDKVEIVTVHNPEL